MDRDTQLIYEAYNYWVIALGHKEPEHWKRGYLGFEDGQGVLVKGRDDAHQFESSERARDVFNNSDRVPFDSGIILRMPEHKVDGGSLP